MRRKTTLAAAVAAAAIATGASPDPTQASEWTVGPAPSDFPDLEAAQVTNEAGDLLYVWAKHRDDLFQVFAEVHLARDVFAGTMPTYTIDGGAVVDTEAIRREGETRSALTGHTRENISIWLVWASPEDVIKEDEPLHEWLTGKELALRYESFDGEVETVRFPLDGAQAAIPDAAGVKAE
jgi:hypothetical protein